MFRYPEADDLERYLGDPSDPNSRLSFSEARRVDEAEAVPEPSYRSLDAWGFPRCYVPQSFGGRLHDVAEALAILRVVQRRDVTVAHQYGNCYLGTLPIWVAGSDALKAAVVKRVLRGERIAFALTERDHGGDISATETVARRVADGYVLSGEKWLISQATTSTALTVFARTGDGPGGFSLFYVEKDRLDPRQFSHTGKIKTQGLRGADISGIRFDGCHLGEDALIGELGGGLTTALKALLVSKAMVASLPLGATDTGLRITTEFARDRKILGGRVTDIAHAKRSLADAFVDLLIADCVTTTGGRALAAAPGQASIHGNVVKAFVPGACERIMRRLSAVLGARFYLREGPGCGAFEKALRDIAIVGVFDGSTLVCQNAIAAELAMRCRKMDDGERAGCARQVWSLAPLPALDPAAMSLHSRGRDDIVDALPALCEQLERKRPAEIPSAVLEVLMRARARARTWPRRMDEAADRHGRAAGKSIETYALASEYITLYAMTACTGLWLTLGDALGPFFAHGAWLLLAVERLAAAMQIPGPDPALSHAAAEPVYQELLRRTTAAEMYSLVPIHLARH